MVLCVAVLTAVSMQVRCVDAAREAARLAARGDDRSAETAARTGDFVVARVTAQSVLLPGITVAAEGVSAVEPVLR